MIEAIKRVLAEIDALPEGLEGYFSDSFADALSELRQACKETLAQPEPETTGWIHLKEFGYAPGDYMMHCRDCKQEVIGVDKRALRCKDCAENLYKNKPAPAPFGYLCDWGNDKDGGTNQVFYYGEPGSAIGDDWNVYPKIHHNLPLYTHPKE